MSLLKPALSYSSLEWPILPLHSIRNGKCTCGKSACRSAGKHPRIKGGLKKASKNPEAIKEWWTKWPYANIGIATGRSSGLIVLDVDGPEGNNSVKGKHLPLSPRVSTGKGLHIYFRHPGKKKIPSLVRFLPGLDDRADGAYVVAPPSLHVGGHVYEWNPHLGPNDVEIAPTPDWLLECIQRSKGKEKVSKRKTTRDFPPAQIEPIVEGCGWMKHCRDDAKTLPEPEWYGMLSILGRCVGGENLAHEWSRDYPNYTQEETEKKLQHAQEAGPRTCKNIRESLNGEPYCKACKKWGQIKSPISLGRIDKLDIHESKEWEKTGIYFVKNGCIHYEKIVKEFPVPIPLCNFTARIVNEEIRDDSAEAKTYFAIEGNLNNGMALPKAEVPAERFQGLGWITAHWGAKAVVYAGFACKDHLRTAIQLLSKDVPRRVVYTHLGWRKIENQWIYLNSGGSIGTNGTIIGVEVSPGEGKLKNYALPNPLNDEDLIPSIRASLSFLDLAPPQITFPLLSAAFRAPLGEVSPIDFSIFVAGPTGSQKSEITAIAQAHYGAEFNRLNLPGNWSSSANSLEKQNFLAKDVIFVIDDFSPTGTASDIARLHRDADRLLRAQGNQAGRGRMRPDGSLRPTYYPRGLMISSGEDIPKGHSLRARMLIIEISKGDVNLDNLTEIQAHAEDGLLAGAMASYVKWLAPQIDNLKKELPAKLRELRTTARKNFVFHDRMPDLISNLAIGWEFFLRFAHETGAISLKEREELWESGWNAIAKATAHQANHHASEDPTVRFLELLDAAIVSGHAHVADAKTEKEPIDEESDWGWRFKAIGTGNYSHDEWQPQGDRAGWIDGENLLLEPNAVFAVVQRMAREQGTCLSVTARTLWKRLREKDILASHDEKRGRNLIRWTVGSRRRSVVHLRTDALSNKVGPKGPMAPREFAHEGLRVDNSGRKILESQKAALKNGPQNQSQQDSVPKGPLGSKIEHEDQSVSEKKICTNREVPLAKSAQNICHGCGGRKFWRREKGPLICAACHPPSNQKLVSEWIEEKVTQNDGDQSDERKNEGYC